MIDLADEQTANPTAKEILRVAARLFAARGYDATPVQAIVDAAGVTKPTLYYHFKSKEGLAQALLTVPLTRLLENLRALVNQPRDPVARLVEFLETHFSFVREDPDRVRFFYSLFFGPGGSALATELMSFGERLDALLMEAVDHLAQAGVIASERAQAFFVLVRGMIIMSTMDYLYCGVELGQDRARCLVDDLLRGFGAEGWNKGQR
jgi:AcrR family transcriptional regulator